MKVKTNQNEHWGIVGLIFAILGLVLFLAPYIGLSLCILAIVFYFIQKNKDRHTGITTAALVVGVIGVIINLVFLLLFVGIAAFFGAVSEVSEEIAQSTSELDKTTQKAGETGETIPKPAGKFYEQTSNGVTLTVTGYTFEKKSDAYGKLKTIDIIIHNQGSNTIAPDLLINVVDKKDTLFTIQKEITLSEWLSEGDRLQKTVNVDLGIGGANNPKELGVHVTELWGDIIVSVKFDTNLTEGFG